MSKSISMFVLGVLCGGLLMCAVTARILRSKGRSSQAEQFVVKLAHNLDTSHPVHLATEHMAKRVLELSGGSVRLEIYPSGQLGNQTQLLEMLQNGEMAITMSSAAPMEGFIPEMGVFGLPYVFRDRAHYWNVLDGAIGQELLAKGEKNGLRGLCYYDSGSRNFYFADKAIKKPEDLQGLKVRVMNSKTAIAMVKALGGSPTPIAWGELYSALQQGIVDGAENNPPSFYSNKHYEVCKHFTLDGHTRIPDLLLVSAQIWDGYPEHVKKVLAQAARDSSVFQRNLWQKRSDADLEACKKLGIQVYEVDVAAFQKKVEPFLATYEGTVVGRLLNRIREVN